MKPNGKYALVVDDDPRILELLTAMLHRRGYQVVSYDNPLRCPFFTQPPADRQHTAFTAFPDIIISDLQMPYVNGLEFLERMHATPGARHNAALVSGAEMKAEDLNRLAEMGISFIPKPVSSREIYRWLDHIETEHHKKAASAHFTPDRCAAYCA